MAEKKISEGKKLQEKLFMKKEHAMKVISDAEVKKADKFCESYKKFLDDSKTEREAVIKSIEMAEKNGFVEFGKTKSLKPGDKVYYNNRGKAIILAVIGTEPLENGVRIAAAHIDSPRLDMTQCPIYEDTELALFKTHYYGGIKKYQWTAIPLSLHGVVDCPQCHEPKLAHRLCKACGYYDGRQVLGKTQEEKA